MNATDHTTSTSSAITPASQRRFAGMMQVMLKELRDAMDRPELEAQTAITFFAIAGASEPPTVLDLMDMVGYTRAGASRNADLLAEGATNRSEGLGLVLKAQDPFDARVRRLKLSKKGEEVLKRIMTKIGPVMVSLVNSMKTQEE